MSKHKLVFDDNIKRIDSLCRLYKDLKTDKYKASGENFYLTDILRAATVLLHAAFEEYFRKTLIDWLPKKADEEDLKKIPISLYAGKKAEKLYLNDLAKYRNKSIDDVINESIIEDTKLKSFGSQQVIIQECKRIGIEGLAGKTLSTINDAVQRRHKIVHEADMTKDEEKGSTTNTGIQLSTVEKWKSAYQKLVDFIEENIETWEKEDATTDC
ncbi:MAG: hypothetical protein GXY60_12470 [Spirochaetales bacterium]|nr:hypothetical protein [Spirochaetales bacterium]